MKVMNTNSEAGMFMKVINTNSDFKCMREIVPMPWAVNTNKIYKYIHFTSTLEYSQLISMGILIST
jgi:hypothetical protein